ncbi:MAG TPA: dihydroorotase family protein [Candidatus Limnocylindria bacterium]|nr:dihydroorotase family protein [Candidatus Limnocylindria bacterium]
MTHDIVIRGAKAILEDGTRAADIAIDGETIALVTAAGAAPKGKREIEADGLVALPGLIDMHSHHREPGFSHKEDLAAIGRQCAAGGVTTSVAMPNVNPPPTTAANLDEMLALYRQRAMVDYNVNASGVQLDEIPKLAERGILAFKIFMVVDTGRSYPHMPGIGLHKHGELYERMKAIKATGLPLMVHPHDQALMDTIEREYWDRGERDFRAYAKAYAHDDGVIWDTAVAVLLRLQEATGVRLHLLHTQTRRVVEMLRAAKAAGRTVSAEVNPWCFWLDNDWANIERLGSYALSYFVAPHHAEAVYAGFRDGTVDIMATDHAPHLREEKEPGWKDGWKAHTGTPSEQFYLSLLLTDVNDGKIGLERVADATATRPAKLFGLYPRKGAIRVGADADIVLVDLAEKRTIRDEDVLSKCGWTPYAGREVRGAARYTFLRGRAIYDDGKIAVKDGFGKQAVRAGDRAAARS